VTRRRPGIIAAALLGAAAVACPGTVGRRGDPADRNPVARKNAPVRPTEPINTPCRNLSQAFAAAGAPPRSDTRVSR